MSTILCNKKSAKNLHPESIASDIFEQDTSFIVCLDLPGFVKKDINIDIEQSVLVVHAQSPGEKKRSLQRQFKLGERLNVQEVAATLEHGVLRLEISKIEKAVNEPIKVVVK